VSHFCFNERFLYHGRPDGVGDGTGYGYPSSITLKDSAVGSSIGRPGDKMKHFRVLACVTAGLGLALLSSSAMAQTLNAALAQAYIANPTLNAQRAGARAFDENVPQALSGYRPTVTGTADVSATTASSRVAGVAGRIDSGLFPRGIGLEINQNLFNGFRTANSVRSAESGVLNQRETLRNAEQDVLFQAVTAYMNVLQTSAILTLQRNNVEVLEEQLKQTRDRFQVGEVTRTDVEQASASLEGARSSALGAEADLKSAIATYRQVIGSEPKRLAPAKPLGKLLPRSQKDAVAIGLAGHPAVTAALHAVDQAAFQVKVAEGALYPSLTASAQLAQRWDAGEATRDSMSASIGAFLNVPIYEGGADYSRVRQTKELLGQQRILADVTREQVRQQVISAWGDLEATRGQILAGQAQVQAAEVALAGVREEAKVGQRTTLDVLNQQQTLLDARTNLVTAQRNQVVASYGLLSAIGRLSARSLGLAVAEYDPRVHYGQVRNKWIGTDNPDGR
jgi:outer membrane protein